jgi:hypothetical protein
MLETQTFPKILSYNLFETLQILWTFDKESSEVVRWGGSICNILTALNNKLLVGGIFCDLHKAFNCINHDILLSKMEFYVIYRKANNLIKF